MAMRILTAALVVCLTGLSATASAQLFDSNSELDKLLGRDVQSQINNTKQEMQALRDQMNLSESNRVMEESRRNIERARGYDMYANPCNSQLGRC